MKKSKVIKLATAVTAVTAGALFVGYVVKKGKFPLSSRLVSDIAKVVSDSTIIAEKSFGGLTQSQINEIVSNTFRGVKAVIDGDTLEYVFKSASGKLTATERYTMDSAGKIVTTFQSFSDANSPRAFIINLIDAMKANGKS
ncbi:hypothetical protein GC098_14170 [Paenibacillus sp. LMG 31458]|uniref:Uncharacterized protein n=1 Tax=Paenibacillus phytorum TaxID=2654977 RepID=A0ABX1XXW4_9BACL|nr:hypothetical protein [Paenibacillus phytorum]NOU72559.1 hypothetical protein [Paenibacillus phytorum]